MNEELLEVLKDFCDYLAPVQTPYEQAIYMHLFRWSYLETGNNKCRRGKRTIAKCALPAAGHGPKSLRGELSYAQVHETLERLQSKEHITIGDTTREGTLYTIHVPMELEAVRRKKAESQPSASSFDYFNVHENRIRVFERDNWKCHYCEEEVGGNNATLDHIIPQSKGGDNSIDNLVTCCLECNAIKSGKTAGEADALLLKRFKEKLKRRMKP